jgi:hypothetical protein
MLQIDVADIDSIQVWNGIFAEAPGRWVTGSAELLWPGSQIYVTGSPDPENPGTILVESLKIVAAPQRQKSSVRMLPQIAAALGQNDGVALLGSRDQTGVYLLDARGNLKRVGETGQNVKMVDSKDSSALLVSKSSLPTGLNSFTWIRSDGVALQIFAEPFYNIQGAAGDSAGNLWWIETPQVHLDQWRLWHYDVSAGAIELVLQQPVSSIDPDFAAASVTPELVAVLPVNSQLPAPGYLLVDTAEPGNQKLYTGLYRVSLPRPGAALSDALDAVRILDAGAYRGPLTVASNGRYLAYFAYNPDHPSLTSGFIRPANQVYVIDLDTIGNSTPEAQLIYETETRWEFLAPSAAWLDDNELVLVRSRFAPGELFGLDRFGVVQIQLPDTSTATATGTSYLFPQGTSLKDLAACSEDRQTLLAVVQGEDSYSLARWDGADAPTKVADLPGQLDRVLACWHMPETPLEIP